MWVKLDDKFHGHPKVVGVAAPALGLWVRCASWVGDQLQDGAIPAPIVRQFGGRTREITALVDAGLWVPAIGGGFVMHDWHEWNPSAEQVKAERRAAKDRREAARLRRADQPRLFP